MTGNRAREGERETERADWGGRETTAVEKGVVGTRRRWPWLILAIGLNQHLGLFGDVNH